MKTIKFRAWLLYNKKTNFYIGKLSSLNVVDYSAYESISLSDYNNTYTDWVTYEYGTQTVYISQYVIFKNITYNKALSFCEKIGTVTINGKSYVARLMPSSFWLDMPNSIFSSLYAYNHLILTSAVTGSNCQVVNRGSRTDKFNSQGTVGTGSTSSGDTPVAFMPVLIPLNNEVNISGEDMDLGNKTSSFGISYSVQDKDANDNIFITEELNGKVVREIESAVCGQLYTFNITAGLLSDLPIGETSIIKITASDGYNKAIRIYTFNRVDNNPTIVYNGSTNLGALKNIPTISYSVSDNNDKTVTITEKLNDKIIYSEKIATNQIRKTGITNSQWSGCTGPCTLEITAENSNGGSKTLVISFSKGGGNRLEVVTKPSVSKTQPKNISLDVGWTTDKATGKIEVCNNALDEVIIWEDATKEIDAGNIYHFKNNTKTSEDWAVSIRVIIVKDSGNTGEVNVYSIRGTYE